MKMTFTIEGAAELERNLATLGRRVHRKVVRQAVRAGQKPVLQASQQNAQSMVGGKMGTLLARTVVIKAPRRQRAGTYALHVEHRTAPEFWHESKSGRRYYVPAAIEYGHVTGTRAVPAIPYRRKAAESTRNETIRVFSRMLRTGLLREAMIARSR